MELNEIVRALHVAIGNEKGACKRYIQFARNTKDEKGRLVLLNLALDEIGHLEKLEKQLYVMMEGKSWVLPDPEEAAPAVVDTPPPDTDIMHADIETLDDLGALKVAMEYEILANKFYLAQALKCDDDDELKNLFLSLAAEEENHKKIIQAEIDSISESGFWFDYQEFSVEME